MRYGQDGPDEFKNSFDQYAQEYLKLQIKQQEMMQAREEERYRKNIEFTEKINEYNTKCAQIPLNALKKWAGSWVVLVLSILSTVTAVCALVSAISNLSNGVFAEIIALVQLLLACLVCAGFWRSYAMGRSKEFFINTGGPRMLKGILTFYKVIMYIVMISLIIFTAIVLVYLNFVMNIIAGQTDTVTSEGVNVLINFANSLLIGIFIALVVVFVILIIYFKFASRFANDVVTGLNMRTVSRSKTIALAVMFFIVGAASLAFTFGSTAIMTYFNESLKWIGDVSGIVTGPELPLNTDIANFIGKIADAGTYLFGGVLAIQFGNLAAKIDTQIQSLEKPVMY